MVRLFLCVVLFSVSLPVFAKPSPSPKPDVVLRNQAEKDLCPQDPEDETICFVRRLSIQGEWAAVRLAYQNSADSLVVYRKHKSGWGRHFAQMAPDWEEVRDHIHSPIPEAVYNKLMANLFPPEPSSP
jgi:hypothetical protein